MVGQQKTAVVIGGGLVGSMCAVFLAKRGYNVDLFEKRKDIKSLRMSRGRSINLALSHRGRTALRQLGLEEEILKNAQPMTGRLLHKSNGKTKSVPYDTVHYNCIYSVSRNELNIALLEEAQKYLNVDLHFNTTCLMGNFRDDSIVFQNNDTGETFERRADLIIGADGANSALRRSMELTHLFEFSQTYIPHGYLELCIPSKRGHLIKKNHLHIWPRGELMMIALPNSDSSWTVTLFMPYSKFEAIITKPDLVDFFSTTFPDALPLIGEEELVTAFFKNKPSPLISVKCNRFHQGVRYLIIGDAAHAMVPFYGQGMNAGFEDCTILNELLDQHEDNIPAAIEEFTNLRKDDIHAICELALYNYEEMRDLVLRPSFLIRKSIDNFLFKMLPHTWVPLYHSVTFTSIDYADCLANRRWQDKILKSIFFTIFTIVAILISQLY